MIKLIINIIHMKSPNNRHTKADLLINLNNNTILMEI